MIYIFFFQILYHRSILLNKIIFIYDLFFLIIAYKSVKRLFIKVLSMFQKIYEWYKDQNYKLVMKALEHNLQGVQQLVDKRVDINKPVILDSGVFVPYLDGNFNMVWPLYCAVHSKLFNLKKVDNYFAVIKYLLDRNSLVGQRVIKNDKQAYASIFYNFGFLLQRLVSHSNQVQFLKILFRNGRLVNHILEFHEFHQNKLIRKITEPVIFQVLDFCGIQSKIAEMKIAYKDTKYYFLQRQEKILDQFNEIYNHDYQKKPRESLNWNYNIKTKRQFKQNFVKPGNIQLVILMFELGAYIYSELTLYHAYSVQNESVFLRVLLNKNIPLLKYLLIKRGIDTYRQIKFNLHEQKDLSGQISEIQKKKKYLKQVVPLQERKFKLERKRWQEGKLDENKKDMIILNEITQIDQLLYLKSTLGLQIFNYKPVVSQKTTFATTLIQLMNLGEEIKALMKQNYQKIKASYKQQKNI